ncbi:MAG TPA: glycoside hydrolase family 2 TIM barrel-domain containing protein [Spirochaetia bacterium]|nr:glycoside hydrolase family 2 TIM barrel-domain containing protein [Spirochaetia bacterium]
MIEQRPVGATAFQVEIRDAVSSDWNLVQRFDGGGKRLPPRVLCTLPGRTVAGVRIAEIQGPAAIRSVGVFSDSLPPATRLASDANGNIIGVVCDGHGYAPCPGAAVTLRGQSAAGSWSSQAHADEWGLFTVPMPLGLRGTVRVLVDVNGKTASSRLRAEDLQYGLTPTSFASRGTVLGEGWRFAGDPPSGFQKPPFKDSGWSPIRVPAHFAMEGFRSLSGVGGYRTRFALATAPGSERLKLLFDGVYSGAEVWVNGIRVAYHEGGALPFEADITDAARKGTNLLAVRVTEHTLVSDHLDRMSYYANFPLAGIMRKVTLFRVPLLHIGALVVETTFDGRFQDATLDIRAAVLNESGNPTAAHLSARLLDPSGKEAGALGEPVQVEAPAWQRVETKASVEVRAPRGWDAEHPNLYTLVLELKQGSRVTQRLEKRIGFRQTDIQGARILINGSPVKIRGTCRHDAHPLMGRAITEQVARRDLMMIKEANLNSVRTSHYPPIPELLDIADEIGIYVEDEGSFCWAEGTDDLRNTPRIMQMNAELLARDRNHPSVFMWSVCNESSFGYGFRASHRWVRAADPRRPTSAATGADLEIATHHNPITVERIREHEDTTAPLLFDEAWCIYQGIFGDVAEMWVDPGIRDYYVDPLPPIYEEMMRSRVTQGSQIWCWSDDIFCVPHMGLEYGRGMTKSHYVETTYQLADRGLSGDAPWGVIDGWRRPKPEYWIIRKLFSPVRITEAPLRATAPGIFRIPVRNDFDHTDLSELSFRWECAGRRGTAKVSARPHGRATLVLPAPQGARSGTELLLVASDASGRVIDEYRFPIDREVTAPPFPPPVASRPLAIQEENLLATRSVRVVGTDLDLDFAIEDPTAYWNHGGGHLRRCVAFGRPLLLEAPQVHLLPSAAALSPAPDRLSWKATELRSERSGRNAVVRVRGTYDRFDAEYEWTISPSGEIEIRSTATWNGEETLAREIGLRFSVPLPCEHLEWCRKAEWRSYPADHIGRPRGRARARAGQAARPLPPTWSWSEDTTPMGTNDFRSTKRHVHWASIRYEGGPGVLVISDGTQHVRAMVEPDRIAVHVLDWYGGTNAGLEEWYRNYGKGRPVRSGEAITSSLRLRLIP